MANRTVRQKAWSLAIVHKYEGGEALAAAFGLVVGSLVLLIVGLVITSASTATANTATAVREVIIFMSEVLYLESLLSRRLMLR